MAAIKTCLLSVFVVLLLATPSFALSDAQYRQFMQESTAFANAEARLQTALKKLATALTPDRMESILKSQRIWEAHRDTEAQSIQAKNPSHSLAECYGQGAFNRAVAYEQILATATADAAAAPAAESKKPSRPAAADTTEAQKPLPPGGAVTVKTDSATPPASQSKPAEAGDSPAPGRKTYTNSIGMKFVLLRAGSFSRSLHESVNAFDERVPGKPVKVSISKPFYLGIYEVTQEQWHAVMDNNPSVFKARRNPVENVTWHDAQGFVNRLNAKEGHTRYRLPTEAEWEYAARAGTKTEFSFGNDAGILGQYAWYVSNSGNKPHPVGQKKPNPWGLYDMHGNVREWVQDVYGDYPATVVTDPKGPPAGSLRVFRGGSWNGSLHFCGSGQRDRHSGETRDGALGFRLALSPQ